MRGATIPRPQLRVPLTVTKPLDVGALPHYWHPDRDGVEQAPADFRRELALASDGQVVAVRPPAGAPIDKRRWLIWYRKPAVTHRLCPGWLLLFVWPPNEYDPIPLDNRVIANLAAMDARRFPSAVAYFDRIVADMKREKAARTKADKAYVADLTHDYYESTKIKNIGKGNKFALHHDGTILPSRGERNWLNERRDMLLPGDVAARERERLRRRTRRR